MRDTKKGFVCKKGHSFDIAAQGYVNLLTTSHRNPKTAGDNAMMVKARTDFLSRGYYRRLADRAAEILAEQLEAVGGSVVIDCGCGEGYYTNIYAAALKNARVYGVDISKAAVKHAAAQARRQEIENVGFAAASCFELPFADRCADLLVCTFAPVSNDEYARVLKKGGRLVIVCPSPIHLYGLKSVLYEEPYLNKPNEYGLKSFAAAGSERLEYEITLENNADIMNLFAMTPYYYKTPEQGRKRLEEIQTLKTECGFDLLIFRKK
jgi:23S rRNA (guanine745-N1)-methyltransferase